MKAFLSQHGAAVAVICMDSSAPQSCAIHIICPKRSTVFLAGTWPAMTFKGRRFASTLPGSFLRIVAHRAISPSNFLPVFSFSRSLFCPWLLYRKGCEDVAQRRAGIGSISLLHVGMWW